VVYYRQGALLCIFVGVPESCRPNCLAKGDQLAHKRVILYMPESGRVIGEDSAIE